MTENMKMGTKIGLGFGITILIAAILGFVGWNGVNNVRIYMTKYAFWGNIDMVMNESVTQNILKLNNALLSYRSEPTEARLTLLNNSGVGEFTPRPRF